MKRIISALILSVFLTMICYGEENHPEEYSFEELAIENDIFKNVIDEAVQNTTSEERVGISGDRNNEIETYNKWVENIIDNAATEFSIKRGETIIVEAYIADNIIMAYEDPQTRQGIDKNGVTRIALEGNEGEYDFSALIYCRTFNDFSNLKVGEKVKVKGVFLPENQSNDKDILYNCEILGLENTKSTLIDDLLYKDDVDPYLYQIGKELARYNVENIDSFPDFTQDQQYIYINKNDYMAEVSSYVTTLDDNGNSSVVKWVTEFMYEQEEGTWDFTYDTIYVYVSGIGEMGQYQIIK